jgi:hypothetical protein
MVLVQAQTRRTISGRASDKPRRPEGGPIRQPPRSVSRDVNKPKRIRYHKWHGFRISHLATRAQSRTRPRDLAQLRSADDKLTMLACPAPG